MSVGFKARIEDQNASKLETGARTHMAPIAKTIATEILVLTFI